MREPKWLSAALVEALHGECLAMFGGLPGVRDAGLLQSALDRPRNLFAYGEAPSLFAMAAAYCAGIVKNHPFIDGNKRSGLLAARAFLFINGYLLEADEADEVRVIVGLAAGEVDETFLASWIEANCQPRGR